MLKLTYRGKRILDLVVSAPALLLSLPIQAVAGLAIRASMGSPILFQQTRPGIDGRPFVMRKFRTMHPIDPDRGWTDDSTRLTRLGAFLRSTSIDELPTIWNIVRGDMSLVGPRPLLMHYLDRYSAYQARRMEVKPGLTGLAQVSGRNAQTWDERFACDVQYVDSASLRTDLKILLKTVATVLRRDGISAHGEATMTEFMGPED